MSETEGQASQTTESQVMNGKPGDPVLPLSLSALQTREGNSTMPMQISQWKPVKLERLLDVPVTLVFEVGRTEITIKELLELTNGSFVDLRNVSVDTIDVRINDEIVAHSETIAMKQGYGVRFGEIIAHNKLEDDDD